MDSYRWKLIAALLGFSALAGAQGGQYNTIRSYQTLATLNTISCSTLNPSGLPEAAVVNDGANNGIYWCSGTNTWTLVSSGGGGGSPGGNVGDFQWKAGTSSFGGVTGLTYNSSTGQFSVLYPGTGIASSGNLFNITDTNADTGTGFMFNVDTASGTPPTQSAMQSFRVGFLGNNLFQAGLVGGTTNGLGMAVFGDQWPLANLAFTGNSSKVTIGINNNSVTALNVFGNYTTGSATQKGLLSLRTNGGSATTDYFMEALYGCGTVTDATCGSGTLAVGFRRDSMLVMPSIATPSVNPPTGYFGMYVDNGCATGLVTLSATGTKTCLGSGGGGGTPGGSSTQYQINNAGAFGGAAGLANSTATGVGTVLVTQAGTGGTDIPALRVTGFATTPASDVFQVAAKGQSPGNTCATTSNCSIWVDASNNFNFLGNTMTLSQQPTAAFLRGYAANTGTAQFSIQMFQGTTGATDTYLYSSSTVAGLPCASSLTPSADCAAGSALATNPMTTAGDLIYGGSTYGSLSLATPTRLGIGSNGNVLFVSSGNPAWGTPASAGVMSNSFPVTVSGATSGGIPYFSSGTVMSSSSQLCQFGIVQGGGAGGAPTTGNCDFTIDSTAHNLTSGAAGVINFSPSGVPMKVPSINSSTTTADAQISFDQSTGAKNFHAFANSADAIVLTSPVGNIINGHCIKGAVTSNNVQLVDTGSACGSGGATALSSISAATATNTITSGNNGSQIWQWDLTSNTQAAWELGENVASTNGTYTNGVPNQVLGEFSTIAGSTASPVLINNSLSGSQTSCALCLNPTWNTTGVVDAGIFENVTNTASAGTSKLLDLQASNTSEFNVSVAGVVAANGAGSFQGLLSSTVGLGSTTNTGAIKTQCGTDNTTGTAGCTLTLRGLDITGGSTASTLAGTSFARGGNNAGTVSTAIAGPGGVSSGTATGNASATQGSLSLLDSFGQAGTVTLWNLECYSSTTTKTVTDCGASPTNIAGVAQNLQGGTIAVTVAQVGSDVPVNLSAAGTVNDTVCAGTTAGKLTDSGGTAPCTAGITVGTIVSVSATPTWRGADGSTATLSTTLALVHLARLSTIGSGDVSGVVTSIATTSPITGGTITSTGTIACATCVTSAASLTSTAFMTGAGSQASQTPSATATLTSGGAPTFPGAGTFSAAGAASTPGITISGAPYTAGTSTTNFPQTYLNSGASAPTTFSTAGTVFGMNTPSGFTGNFEYMCVNGANPCPFQINYQGNVIVTQTAGTQFALNIQNTTAATSSVAQSSPFDIRSGTAWYNPEASTASPPLAAVSVQDCWSHQILETNGSNGTSIYNLVHNNAVDTCGGSPAISYVQVPFQNSWGVQTNALAQASAPTVAAQGTTGAASWSYAIVACIGESCSNVSTATQITNGNATLTTSNWNKVTWTATTNADFYKVYRTQVATSPTTLGAICLIPAGITLECDDKALTGDATTAQVYNATGQVYVGTGPSVGGGSGGGMFATAGTVPTTLVSSAAGWYANSTSGNFDIVNGTADWGYATGVVGKTSQKAETGSADANVLTVTPVAVAGTYRVNIAISVSSATSGVIGWTATWKDSNGNAQTPVELTLFQNGTAAPALTYTTSAAGNYHGDAILDIDNSATNIVIKWIGGGTTAAKMTAVLERIN